MSSQIAVLKRIPILGFMPAAKLRQLLRFSKVRGFPKGSAIFTKADLAKHMFIVKKGRVKIFTSSGAKKRKTFAYLGPNDFFGEMALLDSSRIRSASAQAVEASELLLIHERDFKRFLMSNPKLCYFLLLTLSKRLRASNEQMENMLFRNILGRVAKTVYDLSCQQGERHGAGLVLRGNFTRQDLADLVGTTREPLTRALSTLKKAELIQFHEGRIVLPDPQRLCSLGGGVPDR